MSPKRSILQAAFFLAAMTASLLFVAAARAQDVSARFVGKFTLTSPVHWGKSTLQPGTYSIRIDSTVFPVMALISRDDSTSFAIRVKSMATADCRNGSNTLHLESRKGSLEVQSLALADLKTVLIYDAAPTPENVEEARANTNIPVLVAKK